MTKVGLFFGSFNPVHIGHAFVARYAIEKFKLSRIEFIVSPHNPLKKIDTLTDFDHRLKMVKLMCSEMGDDKFSANPLESFMPHPSYTSDTLRIFKANQILERKRTSIKKSYYIIMGSDALNTIRKWKDYEYILKNFPILVYPRPGTARIYPKLGTLKTRIQDFDTAMFDISATEIRSRIKSGKSIQYMVPSSVEKYLKDKKLYEAKKRLSGNKLLS